MFYYAFPEGVRADMKALVEIEGERGVWREIDRLGRVAEIRNAGMESCSSLLGFYEEFQPKGVAMGLPPSWTDRRQRWVRYLLTRGRNLTARVDLRLAGHLAMVPVGNGGAEVAIFVHRDFQGRGIGTLLLGAALRCARREEGWSHLTGWVQADNVPVRQLLRRAGFVFCPSMDPIQEARLSLLTGKAQAA